MSFIEPYTLGLHVAVGFVALFVAPGAMLARKGSRWHRRWGKVFVGAMSVVAASALFLAVMGGDTFLSLVAIFSFYLAFSGWRVLRRKRLADGDRPPGPGPGGHGRHSSGLRLAGVIWGRSRWCLGLWDARSPGGISGT